jgi:hypothetical protein
MFSLLLLAWNVALIAQGLIHIGERRNKPKNDDHDNEDGMNIPCA